ncbi:MULTISPECIES: hypothetical protein [unclassified Campylobacter]|uniref:hypothetical protein n=1 Tax=unclassified Campylobacter TaxID=2593542 RepID=UPI00167FE7B8|nr:MULTISPECIES: hypothetical protein [unclassified Campylobacter]
MLNTELNTKIELKDGVLYVTMPDGKVYSNQTKPNFTPSPQNLNSPSFIILYLQDEHG